MTTTRQLLRTVRAWKQAPLPTELAGARLPELSVLLRAIGLTALDGEVFGHRKGKLEQAVALTQHLETLLRRLPRKREIVVLEACCGRSYLSFVAHYCLGRLLGRRLHFIGVDANPALIERCRQAQLALGCSDLEFHVGRVSSFCSPSRPDILVSLHACDTATDDALALGLRERARFLLAVSCCQHTAHAQLSARELSAVTRHAPFRERLADMLADSIRCLALELAGYQVDVFEFVLSSVTPKNILLRAEWIAQPRPEAREKAVQLMRRYRVRPALASRLCWQP